LNLEGGFRQEVIYLGTSGFSYDDWKGVFYPRGLAKRDYLVYYADQFPALELNSSYYAIPSPRLIESLLRRTPEDFQIVVKAFRGITHEREDSAESSRRAFLEAVAPLAQGGKLAAVLLQFPYSFHYGKAQLEFLNRLLGQMRPYPTVVEFRNVGWMNSRVLDLLRSHDAALCCVDEPRLPGLMPRRALCTSSRLAYLRFHGRNARKWWNHNESWERYDYLYTREELQEWIPAIRWLEKSAEKAFVFFNNHRSGQAIKNAREMGSLLGLPFPAQDEEDTPIVD